MENNTNLHIDLEDTEEDALSLCDLRLTDDHNTEPDSDAFECYSPSHQDFFEFLTDPNPEKAKLTLNNNTTIKNNDNIIFCGRTLSYREPRLQDSYDIQRPNPFLWRSDSFTKARLTNTNGSTSLRFFSSKPSSGNSRKHKAVFGLAKIPTKMELSDIRKRQSQRAPAPMFPVVGSGEAVVAGARGGGKSHGLLRPLRCRAHLASALARASFGCMSQV